MKDKLSYSRLEKITFEMKRLPKVLSFIVAAFFLLIGLLHLHVHFQDLVTPDVAELLKENIIVMGNEADVWKMWQGFSFMMGVSFIIIGLINIVVISGLKRTESLPKGVSIIMIILLVSVIYSGAAFFGPPQFYGGIIGLIVQTTALFLSN